MLFTYKQYISNHIGNNEKKLRDTLGKMFFNFVNKCYGSKINLELFICRVARV